MKFTRIAALIMAAAMATTLVACNKTDSDTDGKTETNANEGNTNTIAGLDENGHFVGVTAKDVVTLPQYKGLELDKDVVTVSEEDLNYQIDAILENHKVYEKLEEGTIEDGTTANIDYVGSVDGVEFQGGSTGGVGTMVTIGVTNYIDGFLEQLIGHKPGETFDINVTFPDPYPNNTDLSGKEAVFKITVNYIQGAVIEGGELTDEIAKQYEYESAEALISDIKGAILFSQSYEVFETVVKGAKCDNIPDSVIDYLIDLNLSQYEMYAKAEGISMDEFIKKYSGSTYESVEAYTNARMDAYKEEALILLTAQAIAEIEGITVSSEYVKASNYADYVPQYGEPYFKQFLLYQEVVPTFIVDNAVIAE